MKHTPDHQILTNIAARAGALLHRQGERVATAESCTGGWVAQALTAVPGSSAWFEAGFVTYSNPMKRRILQVPVEYLEGSDAPGAVSEPTVEAMAEGARKLAAVDWAVATSGVAGPGGGTDKKPVGMVWIAWAGAGDRCDSEVFYFSGDRESVRYQAVEAALEGLISRLESPVRK
ncbi:MAG: CinA family protein [Pseudohongiella sp.]|nr:CinA family protein [Pseudohongiella sp.]MDP2126213.1 CinA family protein [Pseudohongiella sp.]